LALDAIQNFQQLVETALESHCTISEVVLEYEMENTEKSRVELLEQMRGNWLVMKNSVLEGMAKQEATMGGLVKGSASTVEAAIAAKRISEDRLSKTVLRALAVAELNASMGLIVAAPTAGSCGILPAVLVTAQEEKNYPDDRIVMSLFTAAGIGLVLAKNASIAGSEGGCQAECGSAASMAAGALTELAGGTVEQVAEAVALSLKNVLGLTCDPVGGLVEVPCIKRNSFLAVNAIVASDLALAGIRSVIPVDEVIGAMKETGELMPLALKETAQGGLAATPTGKVIGKKLQKETFEK
jgi:L-serine dehydratase